MTKLQNERKYAKPTVDFIFKRVFGSEQGKPALISLLNAILNFEIVSVTLENPELTKDALLEKGARLDVFARIPHRVFPGGRWLRTPSLMLAMLYYRLRDLL
jgi:hypothetical protein